MKNKQNNSREDYTLLQEIIRTYRYPDGSLNGIAVFISTLALVLLLIFGHFVINGIKNINGMNKVSASELTLSEIEEYITDSYLDAVDDYTKGDINHEAAKKRILRHIAEYLDSSSAFTADQKDEMLEAISQYLESMNIDEFKTNTNQAITDINSIFSDYASNNQATLELLKQTLQNEIDNNNTYSTEQIATLKELYKSLSSTELDHFNDVNTRIAQAKEDLNNLQTKTTENINNLQAQTNENINNLQTQINNNYESFITKLYSGINEWSAAAKYNPNDYVLYNNVFYKNITGVNSSTSPDKDFANWQEVSITTVINNNYQTFLSVTGASDWQPDRQYKPGEYVIYNNMIYQCQSSSSGVTPGSDSSIWKPLTLTEIIDNNYQTFIETIGAKEYDPSKTYQAGDYVIKDGELYRATEDSSGSFDSDKWEKTTIASNIDSLSNDITNLQNETTTHFDDYEQRIQALENKSKATSSPTINNSGENSEFDFGYQNGAYGYWINNSFYPL